MNILLTVLLLISSFACMRSSEQPMQLHVQAKQHAKIKLLLMVLGKQTSELETCWQALKKDLEFSGVFDVTVEQKEAMLTDNELQSLHASGFPLAVFLNSNKHDTGFEWRLYETKGAHKGTAHMVKGKNYHKRGECVRGWAHQIADALWPELTAQDGFFSSKIAYCCHVPGKNNRNYKHICITDYDGSNPQILIDTPTINIAPRFKKDQPSLFYSETGKTNISLVVADMKGNRTVASNFNGINMLPTFSDKGQVVYCASHGTGTCQLYHYQHKKLTRLTNNKGSNISPTMADDGSYLFFCSDYLGKPQIYRLDLASSDVTPITRGSEPCYCPAYCSKKKQLAYTKVSKGVAQVWLYDEVAGKHCQVTFDEGTKDECSWSPCGNYLLYAAEKGSKGWIGMVSLLTGESRVLTAANQVCSYPTWSPVYGQYPVIA